jgi:hypothetical protein
MEVELVELKLGQEVPMEQLHNLVHNLVEEAGLIMEDQD